MPTRGPPVHTHHTRNPWGGRVSLASGSGGGGVPWPPSEYQEPLDLYSQPARTPSPQYAVIEAQAPRLNLAAPPLPVSRAVSERAVTPVSVATAHTEAAVDPCGGHCTACEQFCHYCLQVLFIAGILTGVSLTIAGSVLRGQKRGGDLMVLVYIGCLTAMVCTLLLSVQCCVRRNVERRKRRRGGPTGAAIPLQQLESRATGLHLAPLTTHPQCEPLMPHNTVTRGELSGTPWWRRQPPLQQTSHF